MPVRSLSGLGLNVPSTFKVPGTLRVSFIGPNQPPGSIVSGSFEGRIISVEPDGSATLFVELVLGSLGQPSVRVRPDTSLSGG